MKKERKQAGGEQPLPPEERYGRDWFVSTFGVGRDPELLAETQLFALGDAVVLALARTPFSSIDVDIERVAEIESGDWLPSLDARSRARWATRTEALRRFMGASADPQRRVDLFKVSPVSLRAPLTDFPVALIRYRPVRYSVVRSFFDILLAPDRKPWKAVARLGVDYGARSPQRPGTLCVHGIVLTTEPDGSRMVVLAQRNDRQGDVGFYAGKWSASFEEQCQDGEASIEETAYRGLEEELLGPRARDATVRVQAIFLEKAVLNLTVGVVCVTPLSFHEVVTLWQGCEDRAEHSQIVGLPADADVVAACVRKGTIPLSVRRRCRVHPDFRAEWKSVDHKAGWALHLTAVFRLALALRFVRADVEAVRARVPARLSTSSWVPDSVRFPYRKKQTSQYPMDSREVLRDWSNSRVVHLLENEGRSKGPIEQEGGARHIEQLPSHLVKKATVHPRLLASRHEPAFPILAISPGLRATAFVCVTARFSMHVARMLAPRRHRAPELALAALRAELDALIAQCAPATVVVEHGRKGRESADLRQVRRALLGIARRAGLRVIEARFADASLAISGSDRADACVPILAECYPPVAARLDPTRKTLFRSEDHRRELRPLIAAATLAHAAGLEAIQVLSLPGVGTTPT